MARSRTTRPSSPARGGAPTSTFQFLEYAEAVHGRHLEVEQNHLRAVAVDLHQCLAAVGGLGHHLDVAVPFQQ
jgi:hypothetical protein